MTEHQSSRTLVKSAPELWAECRDAASLARHLGAFGEIRITKLEPETAVAWEGAAVRGTVRLEPSGWGTRVTLTVTGDGTGQVARESVSVAVAEPVAAAETDASSVPEAAGGPEVAAEPEAAAEPEPAPPGAEAAQPGSEAAQPGAEAAEPVPEPTAQVTATRPGVLARLRLAWRRRPPEDRAPAEDPVTAADSVTPQEPVTSEADVTAGEAVIAEADMTAEEAVIAEAVEAPAEPQGEEALAAALDSLGRAHHRPYSRA